MAAATPSPTVQPAVTAKPVTGDKGGQTKAKDDTAITRTTRHDAGDDNGGRREVEPGDDRGGAGEVEPGDDKGGDDKAEPGDDNGKGDD